MKNLLSYIFILFITLFIQSCDDSENSNPAEETGEFHVSFEHFVGSKALDIATDTSVYPYTNTNGQTYNMTLFGYYISGFKLEGPNGEVYEDEMAVSAAEALGYYHIMEGDAESQEITLANVPAGKYNKITFTIGVGEQGIEEGAVGGVLDPAQGAWFWSWNAGYIGFSMNGYSPQSGAEDKSFQLHVGGWKDIPAVEGETQKFYNNVKTISISFGENVTVSESLHPEAHIVVDVAKVLDGADTDFSSTFAVHSPSGGKTFAEYLAEAFILDHIHAD